ncbi:hypothetical protein ZIOFF_041810 [Zingiber officinale]|uniref:Plasma membrane-associated cation-binding protein 1 n=1 Tax=Zingiber officinale TaxID=94328 RepID=A0A8J5L5L6_ZINOF|nr:hypothetical protein ZIOFF_041810 [Zingiber officinale]
MGSIWKSKVLPSFANVFGNSKKKTAAAEAEEYGREFEEKKTELQAKVVEIYEASPAPIKALVKKPTESGLKKNSSGVKKFLEELVKIEFPGSKPVSEAAVTFGSAYVAGPITFIFEEVSSLLPAEEEPPAAPAPGERTSKEVTAEVIEETKKEEEETTPPASATETPALAESTTTEPPPPRAEDAPATEPAKA